MFQDQHFRSKLNVLTLQEQLMPFHVTVRHVWQAYVKIIWYVFFWLHLSDSAIHVTCCDWKSWKIDVRLLPDIIARKGNDRLLITDDVCWQRSGTLHWSDSSTSRCVSVSSTPETTVYAWQCSSIYPYIVTRHTTKQCTRVTSFLLQSNRTHGRRTWTQVMSTSSCS